MRPLQRIVQAIRTRRLPRGWLAAALVVAAAALLAPGVSYATASQASHTSEARLAASSTCRGITPATFPAAGFVANPARTQGGHLWWRRSPAGDGVCIGTVVEFVRYNTTTTKTWNVIIYSAQHPRGQTVAHNTFTLRRGTYFWSFRIRKAFPGLTAVCITADGSFGKPCIHFRL